jgi:hypothetical protein
MADTAIIILTGQSLNVWRGSTRFLETGWAGAKMFVGGGTQPEMDMFPLNNDHVPDYAETTSAVTQAETLGGQSPIAGIASYMQNAGYANVYLFSAARGSADYDTLLTRGSYAALHMGIQRMVELAAVDGYTDPEIVFYHAHGERASTNNRTEQQYIDDSKEFFGRCQLFAAQIKQAPGYRAPIFFSMPLQNKVPTAGVSAAQDITIKTAIRTLMDSGDVSNLFILPTYPMTLASGSDFTHGNEEDFVRRGEYVGRLISDHLNGTPYQQLRVTSVTRDGATVTVQFTHNIVRDATNDFGSSLAGVDGFEYWDNGSSITINTIDYSGDTATLNLASTPVGTDAQQLIHIGLQVTLASGSSVVAQNGTVVRKDQAGWTSTVDGDFTQNDWALQEVIDGLPYTYTPPATGGDLQHNDPALRHNDVTLQHNDVTLRHNRPGLQHN